MNLTTEAALERDHHHGDLFDFGCGRSEAHAPNDDLTTPAAARAPARVAAHPKE